jgi:TonB family protein
MQPMFRVPLPRCPYPAMGTFIVWMLVCLCMLPIAPPVRAQQTPMETAAAHLSGPIMHSKQRKIAVFDFSGPGDRVTALGKQLADDLSVALAKSDSKLKVVDRSQIEQESEENLYAPQIVVDPESLLVFAQELGTETFVMGTISEEPDNKLSVDIKAYRVPSGNGIDGVRAVFLPDGEYTKLLAANLPGVVPDFSKYSQSGSAGYSLPRCLYCPRADYSDEAKAQKVQGTVELVAIIGDDGRIKGVRVMKALPAGLTAEAIKAVSKWRLQPATGPDGKPAAVRNVIEVNFQLY